jgi:hypothetical protein
MLLYNAVNSVNKICYLFHTGSCTLDVMVYDKLIFFLEIYLSGAFVLPISIMLFTACVNQSQLYRCLPTRSINTNDYTNTNSLNYSATFNPPRKMQSLSSE